MPKVFLSFDVEADGDAPTVSNLLSIGIVALDVQGNVIDKYYANVLPYGDAEHQPGQRCMTEFWNKNPEIYALTQVDRKSPSVVMQEIGEFYAKMKQNYGDVTWVAGPSAYDWQWLKGYYTKFNPTGVDIGYSAKCLSTLYWCACKVYNCETSEDKKAFWKKLAGNHPHTHKADDDALEQGKVFITLYKLMDSWMYDEQFFETQHWYHQ